MPKVADKDLDLLVYELRHKEKLSWQQIVLAVREVGYKVGGRSTVRSAYDRAVTRYVSHNIRGQKVKELFRVGG